MTEKLDSSRQVSAGQDTRTRPRTAGCDRRWFRLLLAFPVLAYVPAPEGSQATPERRYPVFTEAYLTAAMKVAESSVAAASTAIAQSDFPAAKLQFIHAREELAPTITFWRDRKKDDAIKMLRKVLAKLDDLDTALAMPRVEADVVTTLTADVRAACQRCHDTIVRRTR